MEPADKKRRLAQQPTASSSSAFSPPDPQQTLSHRPLRPPHIFPYAPHHSQRQEFEDIARHLHHAAVLINRQASQPTTSYTNVSVLLLGWQDDLTALQNVRALQQLLITEYRYHTKTWEIPTVANPSVKLSMQIALFLEHDRPNQLLIIYYSGRGYVGSDGQLYWACSRQGLSARLKWDGVRCLFEEAQSDILLLLDTCAVFDSIASTHGLKQVIAACSPDTSRKPSAASHAYFSPCLTAALRQLSRATSFSAKQLCHEIKTASQANVNSSPAFEPQFFTMMPGQDRNIQLAPLPKTSSDADTPETTRSRDAPFNSTPGPRLNFGEARILVCTTFFGDATADMSAFHSWPRNIPPLALQITVEGMFLGPPTVLLISMPTSLWASVQHDKIWYYLGSITSRNLVSLYDKMIATSGISTAMTEASTATTTAPESLPVAIPALNFSFRNVTRSESMRVLDSGTGSAGARMRREYILCDHCTKGPFRNSSSLIKHVNAAHKRPFFCAFHFAGCKGTFGSKNEWKRHIASQHLCLQYYRCSICLQNAVDGEENRFNRKDLFTQHLRRMHAPLEVQRALANGDDGQQQSEWESYVMEMQQTCLIQRRDPPQRSRCPKSGCANSFEGPTAWDNWTEHVGRHMEEGEGDNIGVDNLLVSYALHEGIIEDVGEEVYNLCQVLSSGGASSQVVSETHNSQAMSTQSSALPPSVVGK